MHVKMGAAERRQQQFDYDRIEAWF
eukprot:SAG11_NODE_12186_length_717_cov_0.736246_3_plen_25_part_01